MGLTARRSAAPEEEEIAGGGGGRSLVSWGGDRAWVFWPGAGHRCLLVRRHARAG